MIPKPFSVGTDLRYCIWLQRILRAGYGRTAAILKRFGTARCVYETDAVTRAQSGLFTPNQLENMKRLNLGYADRVLDDCRRLSIWALAITDPGFPDCLRNIPNPPLVLYIKGKLPDVDNEPAICIVGPREVSEYGARSAYSLGLKLALSGMIIVSGAAKGSDAQAHRGALRAGGRTIAVLGCGIGVNYLPENHALREAIAASGCLISEYPPGVPAYASNFPIRNRLMSALCHATVVIEGDPKSGALRTANHANDQGREVFVIPGSPGLQQYEGSNALLRDGAHLLLDLSDIWNEYLPLYPDKIDLERVSRRSASKQEKGLRKKILAEGLSKEAKIVYNYLDKQNFTADDLSGTGLSDDSLLAALTELEIEQYIRAIPGGQYTLV